MTKTPQKYKDKRTRYAMLLVLIKLENYKNTYVDYMKHVNYQKKVTPIDEHCQNQKRYL